MEVADVLEPCAIVVDKGQYAISGTYVLGPHRRRPAGHLTSDGAVSRASAYGRGSICLHHLNAVEA